MRSMASSRASSSVESRSATISTMDSSFDLACCSARLSSCVVILFNRLECVWIDLAPGFGGQDFEICGCFLLVDGESDECGDFAVGCFELIGIRDAVWFRDEAEQHFLHRGPEGLFACAVFSGEAE